MDTRTASSIRKSLVQSGIPTIAVLAVIVIVAYGIDGLFHPQFSQVGLVITGLIMALLPAMAWIFFFYQQDRREPEPKGMVAQVFVLGGLLAMAIAIPVVEDLFQVSTWLYENFWVQLAGSILVIGFVQEFLKYCAVRFSVYPSAEFDERTDGIIYATAAGLGFSTVLNVAFVVNSGGVDLGNGMIRITLTALAHASFTGITGYFLSKEKLDGAPAWWMPVGVSIAAVLNGIFFTLYGTLSKATITASGAFIRPWVGLLLAVVLAVAVSAFLTIKIQRDQHSLAGKGG